MNLVIVFVLNMDSLDFLIVIPNLCILWINLDLQIFIKSNSVYSSLFWINVGISRPSRRTWWFLLTLKYKDNRWQNLFQNPGLIRETNLLSLIRSWLDNVFLLQTFANDELVNLRKFVWWKPDEFRNNSFYQYPHPFQHLIKHHMCHCKVFHHSQGLSYHP
jgi:hypothetical protein